MEFLRIIKDSDELSKVIDIPKGLRNKRLEVIIFPYENIEEDTEKKRLRGALSKYKNEELQDLESGAWSKAVVGKYENS
ncbi:MAG: hypothetical protein WCZ27_01930 [Tissierellaceae bacterium]|nr:hypothetical protein [Tissierellaceae bacterium]